MWWSLWVRLSIDCSWRKETSARICSEVRCSSISLWSRDDRMAFICLGEWITSMVSALLCQSIGSTEKCLFAWKMVELYLVSEAKGFLGISLFGSFFGDSFYFILICLFDTSTKF